MHIARPGKNHERERRERAEEVGLQGLAKEYQIGYHLIILSGPPNAPPTRIFDR
jgi:hypothetical protein